MSSAKSSRKATATVALILLCAPSVHAQQGAGIPSIEELEKQLEQKEAAKEAENARQRAARPATPAVAPAQRASTAATQALAGEFVDVPAGEFRMGDIVGDGDADEKPVHSVTVKAFRVGRHEVTRGQFAAFVRVAGYQTDAERDAGGAQGCYTFNNPSDFKFEFRAGYSWRDPGYPQTDAHPVVCVSWNDAQAYIKWLNEQTGRRFRLASEAEWEYVARAGNSAKYPWGMDANQGCRHANGADRTTFPDNSSWTNKMECSDGFFYTAPVGSLAANEFGVNDMVGNVWEWTQDCWHDSYAGAPGEGSAWTSGDCSRRVLRGGSWDDGPADLRVSNRGRGVTASRSNFLGFRLAQD